jgi:hypothetical protein
MTYRDVYIAEQTMNRRADENVRKAEARRLARRLQAEQGGSTRFYSRALAGLGDRLVAWGDSLQARYSKTASKAMQRTANRLAS